MRNRKTQGFTLIELLIVIAIIGILAAVLIPNLLSAREAASNRAAQSHGRNVLTAITAYLADDINATIGDVGASPIDCTNGLTVDTYVVGDPGASVADCEVTYTDATGVAFVVTVDSSPGETYTFQ